MATLNKKLKIKSGSSTQSCNLYTTTTEAGTNNLKLKVDNQNAYAALGGVGDNNISKARVKKNGTTYAIKTTAGVPYGKKEYRTPGTYTFTVPSGVTKIKVEIAGAGGGGGGGTRIFYGGSKTPTDYKYYTGGNGGRGGLTNTTITISSSTVAVKVGAGGSGGSDGGEEGIGGTGTTGGSSSVANITAKGGTGGTGGYYRRVGKDGSKTGNGSIGTSYGNGGIGGSGGTRSGSAGANGWVIIEYGGTII